MKGLKLITFLVVSGLAFAGAGNSRYEDKKYHNGEHKSSETPVPNPTPIYQ